jgi:cardiolipin synthase
VIVIAGALAGLAAYVPAVIALTVYYGAQIHTKLFHRGDLPPPRAIQISIDPNISQKVLDNAVREKYCGAQTDFIVADRVRLLIDGKDAFPEMLAAIDSAREWVVLETYIFRSDRTGTRFAEAMSRAARRGVRVRLIYDGIGGMHMTEGFVEALLKGGVDARVYHPFGSLWRGGFGFLQRRDHRKILIADGRVSFIGGLNIADEYAPTEEGGGDWRDTHVRIDGETPARSLLRLFEKTWTKSEPPQVKRETARFRAQDSSIKALPGLQDRKDAPVEALSSKENAGAKTDGGGELSNAGKELSSARATSENVPIRILSNRELLRRIQIKRAYLRAIRAAERYILIENAFFIPDRDILRGLYRARKRGVAVGVVVAMKSDVGVAALASRALYDELLAHGVRLFEYPVSMIHSKVAVIDDCWSIVSSYNLNHRSLQHDLEVGALFFDARFAIALRDQMLIDITYCNEIFKEQHRARPWNIALTESLCYQFRYWL